MAVQAVTLLLCTWPAEEKCGRAPKAIDDFMLVIIGLSLLVQVVGVFASTGVAAAEFLAKRKAAKKKQAAQDADDAEAGASAADSAVSADLGV